VSVESAPPPDAPPATPEVAPPPPTDIDATQGEHFRRLLRHRLTLIGGGVLALVVFVAGSAAAGIAIGAAALAATALLIVLIVFLVANARAKQDFFRAYADGRGLRWTKGKSMLPPLTPLLSRGDERYAEQRFDGVLPGGMDGSLCLYTYEEETRDSDGNKQTSYFHFTVGITQLPATAPFIRELFCQRRFGFRFLDGAEDVFRRRQRVEHESEAVDKRYEVFTGADDDLNRARQVLSPTFLVWLESHSPEKFAFELVAGSLVTNVKGHLKSATELDDFCTASAAVARRLHEEAQE
jgi:hypothetical protein